MISDIVCVGDKIELVRQDSFGRPVKSEVNYISQLLDIISEDMARIALPIANGLLVPLEVGENYSLCFYTEKGLFQCTCTVSNRFKENNLYIADILLTSDLEKVQRRQYYRCQCVFDITYHYIDDKEKKMKELLQQGKVPIEMIADVEEKINEISSKYDSGIAIDLSGGGLKFTCGRQFKKDDLLMIRLPFSSGTNDFLEVKGRIVGSERNLKRDTIFDNRVEFVDIAQRQREDIIRFIFEQERRIRQNKSK